MFSYRRIITILALSGYLFVSMFGLYFILVMPQHSMSSMEPCPFMLGEHAICPMTTLDHVNAWRNTMQFSFVKFFSLAAMFLLFFTFIVLKPPSLFYFYLNKIKIFEDFFTILFSRGLLNGKVF
jgi:hypothetical protein